jgi:serine/threonine protein phosphatase PrpC
LEFFFFKERLKDGCTAVVALLYGDLLYTANLGDSAAILAAETGKKHFQRLLNQTLYYYN